MQPRNKKVQLSIAQKRLRALSEMIRKYGPFHPDSIGMGIVRFYSNRAANLRDKIILK